MVLFESSHIVDMLSIHFLWCQLAEFSQTGILSLNLPWNLCFVVVKAHSPSFYTYLYLSQCLQDPVGFYNQEYFLVQECLLYYHIKFKFSLLLILPKKFVELSLFDGIKFIN